ncbi:MAG: hypothetical protein HY898_19130 [Deltaproteobacteria bacterium]|nr:hypothetical protein [Deltaproteobacteria bacterium]
MPPWINRRTWRAGAITAALSACLASCGGVDGNDSSLIGGAAGQAGSAGSAGADAAQGGAGQAGHDAANEEAGDAAGFGGFATSDTIVYRARKVDKVDFLFMIDNSPSMGDKQAILAEVIPDLAFHITNPQCIHAVNGGLISQPATPDEPCPLGSIREFEPVRDMHLGVISSSIGGHGASVCTPGALGYKPHQIDMAHLLSRDEVDNPVPSWNDKGFLFWDPQGKGTPHGDANLQSLIDKFAQLVRGPNQDGCGFEASLEAWYRFLVDPMPYQSMEAVSCDPVNLPGDKSCRVGLGIDETLLQQRADFLRPDSLLAVVMLTDENDCSIRDDGQNYLAAEGYGTGTFYHLPRATAACADHPDSPLCMPCSKLADPSSDPECAKGEFEEEEDAYNLRCYRQKQRFGNDFLWPIKRYVLGLTRTVFSAEEVTLYNTNFNPGTQLNPLFCPQYGEFPNPGDPPNPAHCKTLLRDPSLVLLGGILGVPWQDIAVDPDHYAVGYHPAERLAWKKPQFDEAALPVPAGVDDATTLWDVVLGGVDSNFNIDFMVEPRDPLMTESIDPRQGVNPATGAALAPAEGSGPEDNPINSHEWKPASRDDLQFACTFRLPEPRKCTPADIVCDCSDVPLTANNPVCQADTGEYGNTQYRAKAYPGRRQLAALKGVGDKAIVASICPANTTHPGSADYGYRPAVNAIIDRLKQTLNLSCWDKKLTYGPGGAVACTVLEATRPDLSGASPVCPPCDSIPWRKDASAEALASLATNAAYIQNDLGCACEIPQAVQGTALDACIHSDEQPASVDGWCYVDPSQDPQAALSTVVNCSPLHKRVIRFVGDGNPQPEGMVFILCE